MPYLVLKALWLSGSAVGARNPALNGVTVVLDLFVIARVPRWPIVLSGWVGTGFGLSMVLAILAPSIHPPRSELGGSA